MSDSRTSTNTTSTAEVTTNTSSERGRGRGGGRGGFRGRGRSRGRGRGRGGANAPARAQERQLVEAEPTGGTSVAEVANASTKEGDSATDKGKTKAPYSKPNLTHFIAVPLGHNPALRAKVTAFTDALLSAEPAIPGLDTTIVIPARRLHFTLGVMSLQEAGEGERTVGMAVKLLHDLKPEILEVLDGNPLRVSLDSMDIMKPIRRDPENAHVMWIGPAQGKDRERFEAVGRLIQEAFKAAGLLVDEGRPLKLHCTVVNTIYRKPRPQKGEQRTPFSYPSILASAPFQPYLVNASDSTEGSSTVKEKRGPVRVDFGQWDLNELQICKMGSTGPEGEYVAVASCFLKD